MKNSKRYRFGLAVIIWAIVMIVIYLVKFMSFNDHHYVARVVSNETVYLNRPCYVVSVKDDKGNLHELRNDDNLFRLKFNSSKIYDEITVGKTYDFTVVGFRDLYENIIEIKEVG